MNPLFSAPITTVGGGREELDVVSAECRKGKDNGKHYMSGDYTGAAI